MDPGLEAGESMRFEGSVEFADGTLGDPGNVHIAMCCEDGCQTPEWGPKASATLADASHLVSTPSR